MKKSLAALALLSAFVPATVWAADPGSFSYSGLYGGGTLGFSAFTDHVENGAASFDQGATGLSYGGYVGYGSMFQGPWYLGGELGLGNTTGSITNGNESVNAKETQNYLFSADLRGGKVIGQSTLAYAKLGWGHADFDQTVIANGVKTKDDTAYDGIRFGAGAETLLSTNLTGRLEAIYTDYGSQVMNNTKFAPSDVGVHFGVSYYFY